MALSFLEPPLTSYCISNEIQELTSSAPLCFSDLMAFYPLSRKLSYFQSNFHSSAFDAEIFTSEMISITI